MGRDMERFRYRRIGVLAPSEEHEVMPSQARRSDPTTLRQDWVFGGREQRFAKSHYPDPEAFCLAAPSRGDNRRGCLTTEVSEGPKGFTRSDFLDRFRGSILK